MQTKLKELEPNAPIAALQFRLITVLQDHSVSLIAQQVSLIKLLPVIVARVLSCPYTVILCSFRAERPMLPAARPTQVASIVHAVYYGGRTASDAGN